MQVDIANQSQLRIPIIVSQATIRNIWQYNFSEFPIWGVCTRSHFNTVIEKWSSIIMLTANIHRVYRIWQLRDYSLIMYFHVEEVCRLSYDIKFESKHRVRTCSFSLYRYVVRMHIYLLSVTSNFNYNNSLNFILSLQFLSSCFSYQTILKTQGPHLFFFTLIDMLWEYIFIC